MIDATTLSLSLLHEKLGIEITRVNVVKVVGFVLATGDIQLAGLLHGGATAALVEDLASLAAWLHVRPERVVTGVNLNLTHPRPVVSGRITGGAVPVYLKSGTTVHTAEMHNKEGRLTAVGRLTSRLVIPRE